MKIKLLILFFLVFNSVFAKEIKIDTFNYKKVIEVRSEDEILINKTLIKEKLKLFIDKEYVFFVELTTSNLFLIKNTNSPDYYHFKINENKSLQNYNTKVKALNSENYLSEVLFHNQKFKFISDVDQSTIEFIFIDRIKQKEISSVDKQDQKADKFIDDVSILETPKIESYQKIKFNYGDNILYDSKLLMDDDELPSNKKDILKKYGASIIDPFLKNVDITEKHSGGLKGSMGSNIAKTDVTNFATGMARFLADRAKQELNESFFIQMHKQMERIPELQMYFPESYKFLKRLDANTMSFDLEYLKNRFEKDIKLLPNNILDAINQADETKFPYFRTANHYLNHDINGLWLNIGLQSVMHSNGNINPKDLLYHFVHSKDRNQKSLLLNLESKIKAYDDKTQINLINSIKLAELVSNSLLSPETGRYWVSSKEINDLISDDKLFQTYIGLLLAKSNFEEYKIKFDNTDLKDIVEKKFAPEGVISDLKNLKNLITEIYQTYQTVEDQINDLKTTKNNNELADKSYEAFGLVKTSVTKIQTLISKNEYLGKKGIVINTDVLSNYIDPSVEVAYNLFNKKYNLAIKNFVHILNQVPSVSKFMSDYDLINLIEKVDAENLNKLNGQKLITSYLQQKGVRQSLINSDTLNENDIDDLIKNGNIDKTKLLKLVKSKENEINTFLKDNKEVKTYFENQGKDYSKFISKFTTYGTLIANVSAAQNSDEVKAAIQAAVLPVGSSRIKRYSDFSVMANAYVGGFYGQAYYKVEGEKKSISTFGVTAPIGVTVAWGKMKFLGDNNALSLNVQLIDLGSLVNFYYQKGDGAQLPPDTKVQLGDILAPGASVSYSLFNSPFSIFAGAQYVPNLSRMEAISTNTELKPLTWRWHAGIAIDIPLLSLWVKN